LTLAPSVAVGPRVDGNAVSVPAGQLGRENSDIVLIDLPATPSPEI
jgi:hypothetical protein